jgi:hypothetical protein
LYFVTKVVGVFVHFVRPLQRLSVRRHCVCIGHDDSTRAHAHSGKLRLDLCNHLADMWLPASSRVLIQTSLRKLLLREARARRDTLWNGSMCG